jgi:hypothetical protein
MTYELPFGRGKKWFTHSRLIGLALGGWSYSWNFSVWAPTPVSLGYSGGTYTNPLTGVAGARQTYPSYEPDPGSQLLLTQLPQLRDGWQDIGTNRFAVTGQNPLVTNCGTTPILQPNGATWGNQCVVVAPDYTRGNMPNNFFHMQRIIGANTSIYKDFTIKERLKGTIRMDYYNPFKWFNWSNAITTMTQNNPAVFMTPGLSDFGDSTEGGPSQIHISFRVKF